MSERIDRLRAEDFEEAMAFLNDAFAVHGPHDFARLLPSLYQPDDEHMGHNLGLRRDGRLVAMAGVFPIELQAAGERLRIAGVGGVSVAPAERGHGLLERIMVRVRDVIVSERYPLSYLIGPRQRYRRWGWEVAGANLRYALDPRSFAHFFRGAKAPALELEPLGHADEATARRLKALHDEQPLHCLRKVERFERYLRSWMHEPWLARSRDGDVVGYACVSGKGLVTELVGTSTEVELDILRRLSERSNAPFEVLLRALPSPLARKLGELAERAELRASGNWQIWDFAACTGTLIRTRHAARPLPGGRVVFGVSGEAKRYALWVDEERAGCDRVDESPAFEARPEELARLLFGPLPPSHVRELPAAAAALSAWCPLPLAISTQDQV